MSILVIGSVALDTVSTPFGSIQEGLGGSATHFSVSASYYTDIHIVAVVGADFPQKHLDFLQSKHIDISGIQKSTGKTFRWTGKYDYDLNNAQTLKTELNVLETFNPEIPASLKKTPYLFLANIDPILQRKVIEQVEKPKLIALDTMNFWIESKRDELIKTLKLVDLITINEGEARLLAQEPNLLKAAKKIQAMGPKTLVIKRGEYGALLISGHEIFSAPGLPLEAVLDPTGAGDSFAGGFMGAIAKQDAIDWNALKKAVIYGSVMASFNVEQFSCEALKNLTMAQIKERFGQFKKLSHFDEIHF